MNTSMAVHLTLHLQRQALLVYCNGTEWWVHMNLNETGSGTSNAHLAVLHSVFTKKGKTATAGDTSSDHFGHEYHSQSPDKLVERTEVSLVTDVLSHFL